MKLSPEILLDVVTRVGIPLVQAIEALRASLAARGVELDNAELDAMAAKLDALTARAHADAQGPG